MIKVTRSKKGQSNLKKLQDFLKNATSYYVEIGWFDKENVVKAYLAEYGGISGGARGLAGKPIPPRPVVSPALKKLGKRTSNIFAKEAKKVMREGGDVKEAYKQVAEAYVDEIQSNIIMKHAPILSDKSTIPLRRRGGLYKDPSKRTMSIKPLIQTGEFFDALTYKIKRKRQFESKNMEGVRIK